MNEDKATRAYWDALWKDEDLPPVANPRSRKLNHHAVRMLHRYFVQIFPPIQPRGKMLLEIGAARSEWLPYFALEFGFKVTGLDYSEPGVRQGNQMLARAGVPGEVVCADLFTPPANMPGQFDVVVSFGVVEHFKDTADCIRALAAFLKPGGLMMTLIPNLHGLVGLIQPALDKAVYDVHVPLTRRDLDQAHQAAGLKIVRSGYYIFNDFGVCNVSERAKNWRLKRFFIANLIRATIPIWLLEEVLFFPPPNRLTSPYIICTAVKEKTGGEAQAA